MRYSFKRYIVRKIRTGVSEEEYRKAESERAEEIGEWNRQEIYRRYKRDYKLRKRRMDKKGRSMDTAMLDESDFFTNYESAKNDMISDLFHRRKKTEVSPQKVIDRIISDQTYDVSIRQARAYKEALQNSTDDWDDDWPQRVVKRSYYDKYGIYHAKGTIERVPITPENIRSGAFGLPLYDEKEKLVGFTDVLGDLFENIRDFRAKEFAKGKTAEEVRDSVRSTYFGSK